MHFYFILCVGVFLLTCVSASCVLPGTQEVKRGCEVLELGCVSPCGCLELSLGSLGLLTAELSSQTWVFGFGFGFFFY